MLIESSRGFVMPEALMSAALGALIMLGAGQLISALQHASLRIFYKQGLEEDMQRLALTIGKSLQRAGYCRKVCAFEGLRIQEHENCVLIQRDKRSGDGRERIGYRLKQGSLETHGDTLSCVGKGWEKMTNPVELTIKRFTVVRKERLPWPPLLTLRLEARSGGRNAFSLSAESAISGFNL